MRRSQFGAFGGPNRPRIIGLGRDLDRSGADPTSPRARAPLVWYLRMRELERDPTDSFDSTALRAPLAVVGPGRVGRSLARAALDAGLEVELAGRRDAVAAAESAEIALLCVPDGAIEEDRKSTRLNSSHVKISYAVFCLK